MTDLRDLDPALPALPEAFAVELVVPRLEVLWRDADGPGVSVEACTRREAVYEPGLHCVVTYDLSGGAARTLGAAEVTPNGVSYRLYHQDPRLPQLAEAANLDAMRPRFHALGAELRAIAPLRYKPGRRCVVGYRLESDDEAFVGKLFRDRGQEVMSTTLALHEASRDAAEMPRILRPIAYWDDLQLLLQPFVSPGGELRHLAFDAAVPFERRLAWLRDVGIGLGALHASVGADGPRRTIADELRLLERLGGPVRAVDPGLADEFDETLGVLVHSASSRPEAAPVPSHGAFRLDQLLVDEQGLVMLDVDGFCWANPGRDVGNLLAYLDWKAIRLPEHAEIVGRAQGAFLEGCVVGRGNQSRGGYQHPADCVGRVAGVQAGSPDLP